MNRTDSLHLKSKKNITSMVRRFSLDHHKYRNDVLHVFEDNPPNMFLYHRMQYYAEKEGPLTEDESKQLQYDLTQIPHETRKLHAYTKDFFYKNHCDIAVDCANMVLEYLAF